MARYVLLRVQDDSEADDLLRDLVMYPTSWLLTPSQENTVSAELVPGLDPSDARSPIAELDAADGLDLESVVRRSCERASELAAEWEASA